jgi:hypothetical protein
MVAAYYLWAYYLSRNYPPNHFAGAENWIWVDGIKSWMKQHYFLPGFRFLAFNYMWGIAFLILFFIGLTLSFFKIANLSPEGTPLKSFKPYLLFHYWLAGCLFFYLIGAKELMDNFHNFLIFCPVIAAFGGKAIIAIAQINIKKLSTVFLRSLLIVAVVLYSSKGVFKALYQPLYWEDVLLGKALLEENKSKEPVIVIGNLVGSPVGVYYSHAKGWVFPPAEPHADWYNLPATDDDAIRKLEDLISKGAKWFGVVTKQYESLSQKLPGLKSYLDKFPQIKKEEYIIFHLEKQ